MSGGQKFVLALLALMLVSEWAERGFSASGCGVRVEFNSASRDAGGE